MTRVLVIGAGIGGMSAGIALRRHGIDVDLIDIDPHWKVYGAGITITGPTLRALHQLGLYDDVARLGYAGNGIRVCGVDGNVIRDLPTPMPASWSLATSGGIMRPVLHAILSGAVQAAGCRVRLGVAADVIAQDATGVDVTFSDHSEDRYDLVVGADGIASRTRTQIFPDAPAPQYTGQSVWRTVAPRPAHIDRRHYFLGGPVKVGFTPVSDEEMYLFVLEATPQEFRSGDLHVGLRNLLADYGGPVADIRNTLSNDSAIVFRPLEAFVLPAPWHVGRVLLIGDAAHPTTPQLASGAGLAIEDAIVLAEELAAAPSPTAALRAFTDRREPRCRLVVDNSIAIGQLEQRNASVEQQTALVEQTLTKLQEPI